ncbi:MAG: formyltetrahydrofolate deformylase [Moraxella sp.]|uniref:formyltetrahydrofolate deformylase n=1 Tax=Moraxella sp. TaxID=479 RepID=UPI0026DDBA0F|nr:formyltetrahydrofolate deformylase [Moraxella sp.]MDO4449954.1 formyltetrahydrofolate deformylase [Moraxella sp.]
MNQNIATLLVTCADQAGIVQAVSGFLYHHGANIISLDQHTTEAYGGKYFMRVAFHLDDLINKKSQIIDTFEKNIASKYQMTWRLSCAFDVKKVGILVSKENHALLELLWRYNRGALPCQITQIVSNHEDLRADVERFGIEFIHIPVNKDNKEEAYQKIHDIMQGNDLLVLARYMQILTPTFVEKWENKIINIHHSFLPAFVGANPYKQAFDKGVKLIGATAHYVTSELDQGPIIEQDVKRVSHAFAVEQLRELGRDIEREVLSRAVKWHLEDRIILDGNKTVVFK